MRDKIQNTRKEAELMLARALAFVVEEFCISADKRSQMTHTVLTDNMTIKNAGVCMVRSAGKPDDT
jgi:hypothetical protein